ncbi:MAG: threonine-phosphate decarboxylase [Candidatus Muproteobacteria bacterium RBG_16_64_11]|uniref:threonine-phosphate decarboxylase n=1 Tax=Candidatus Muproteobacteria bacterium RBG_16_64_11 TaxID=1817758 RepID=A0A1F6TAN9_9PROT|nr:MAG: threonine-phosphate decarboxylase [Candidatus Muproteobacteria bacterium RBG_16_64_11]
MLEHGGRLREASVRYGIALERWLDLSTGINPCGWPVPAVPAAAWSHLPEDEDGLDEAVHSYYGTRALLTVAGSQAAIQSLPQLRAPCHVGVLHPGYAEHAQAWRRAGHAVTPVGTKELDDAVPRSDVLVLIHPNNPTGARFSPDQLLDWHAQLAACGGWLIVDEAFMDATPEHSLAPYCPRPGLIVLRSLGKFFGLAGARVGFVLAEPLWLERLRAQLGPWTVATPSRWLAVQALRDRAWQEKARRRLEADGERLATLLRRHGLAPAGGCALFQWVCTPRAVVMHEHLARRGILTRLFEEPPSLRFGLPGTEPDWLRLEAALAGMGAHDLRGVCA